MLYIIWHNLCVLHDCPFAISHTHLAFWITSAIKWQRGTAVSILNVHTSCVMLGLWLRGLSSRFSHVIGLDQSQNLLEKAVDYRALGQLNWNTQEQLSFSSGPWSCFWCSKASWQCRLSSSPCNPVHFTTVYLTMFMDAIGGGKNAMSSAPNWFLKFGRRGRTNQNCCMKRKTRLGDSVQQARSASVSILLCFFFPYKPLGSSRRSDYAKWSPFSPFYNECWLAWLWLFVKSYDYVILFNIKSSHVMHKLLLLHPKLALRWSCVPLWTLASPVWKNMDHMVRTCSNGSCWIQGVRSGAFGHVDLTIQMYPNDPKCIYFYPRLTRCHSHPHIWLPAGVLWAGSSGHKTEGRLGSKLQRLDLPAAWQMGCCAVWSWFGLRTTDYHCTSSWGTKKQGRSLAWVASGKIWQDMARSNLLLYLL